MAVMTGDGRLDVEIDTRPSGIVSVPGGTGIDTAEAFAEAKNAQDGALQAARVEVGGVFIDSSGVAAVLEAAGLAGSFHVED